MVFFGGQVSDQPRIDGSESEIVFFGAISSTRHIVQNPFDFWSGKVGVRYETGLFLENGRMRLQFLGLLLRASALPDNGTRYRLCVFFAPNNRGFPLVCHSNCGNIFRFYLSGLNRAFNAGNFGFENFVGVMLHPAWFREVLSKLLLVD